SRRQRMDESGIEIVDGSGMRKNSPLFHTGRRGVTLEEAALLGAQAALRLFDRAAFNPILGERSLSEFPHLRKRRDWKRDGPFQARRFRLAFAGVSDRVKRLAGAEWRDRWIDGRPEVRQPLDARPLLLNRR